MSDRGTVVDRPAVCKDREMLDALTVVEILAQGDVAELCFGGQLHVVDALGITVAKALACDLAIELLLFSERILQCLAELL